LTSEGQAVELCEDEELLLGFDQGVRLK
jgi:hypothetical protein